MSKTDSPQPVFAKSFLASFETATVADLQGKFRWKQPPEIEKFLTESDLAMSAGMSPRDGDGNRGDNLILVGGSSGPTIARGDSSTAEHSEAASVQQAPTQIITWLMKIPGTAVSKSL